MLPLTIISKFPFQPLLFIFFVFSFVVLGWNNVIRLWSYFMFVSFFWIYFYSSYGFGLSFYCFLKHWCFYFNKTSFQVCDSLTWHFICKCVTGIDFCCRLWRRVVLLIRFNYPFYMEYSRHGISYIILYFLFSYLHFFSLSLL